jgi:hypothetical protein
MRSTSGGSPLIIFLGPTLEQPVAAATVPEGQVRGPAAIGDIYRAVQDGVRIILLVDGSYERVPAVWHKEILWAISRGVRVLGAGSMGALRAAELCSFGMIGIGGIFEDFRNGRLVADDEVAVLHQPAMSGHRPLSVALVDIRATLAKAVATGVIEQRSAEVMLAAAVQSFYADRDYPMLISALRRSGCDEEELRSFAEWVPTGQVSRKRDDTLLALDRLASLQADDPVQPPPVPFQFAHTYQWQLLVDTEGSQVSGPAPAEPVS